MKPTLPTWVSLLSLLALVVAIPVYALQESRRMEHTSLALREQYVREGIDLYLQNCASCHGSDGLGVGMMPALNRSALAEADNDLLFKTIARASHGSAMASWHVEEGGLLNDYQLQELVALIQHGDWAEIERVAAVRQISASIEPAIETGLAFMDTEEDEDPHQCLDCHEEPAIHADLFGLNCARCHNTQAWKPALLTRHEFLLDHGGHGDVDCKTCHPNNYVQYDCYGCHEDHQPAEMETAHLAEKIDAYDNCASCHPTGVSGEADRLRQMQPPQPSGRSLEPLDLKKVLAKEVISQAQSNQEPGGQTK